jgi:ornithine decarboxylase
MSSVIAPQINQSMDFLPTPPASQPGRERQKSVSAHGQPLSELLNKLDSSAVEQAAEVQQHLNSSQLNHTIFLPTPPPSSPRFKSIANGELAVNEDALAPVSSVTATQLIHDQILSAQQTGSEKAFFVGDLSATYEAVKTWRDSPLGDRVEIFYAVKCNPSPVVLHLLSLMGTSFDCASTAEIDLVLSLPTAPSGDRIIFANPCKPASYIRSAARAGVEMMTFDNADELYKIARHYPQAKLVLRILTDDSKSLCRLGLKYGAPLATCSGLLALAAKLGLNVIGVSFHVGSGCKDPNQFTDAVWRARQVFDMGAKAGFNFTFLDVGGGFERDGFAEMSVVLRDALEQYFPREQGTRIVAEPGRFLVSTAFTLATNVIARRRAIAEDGQDVAAREQEREVQKEEGEGADVMCKSNRVNVGSDSGLISTGFQTTSTTASTGLSTASCLTTRSSTHTRSPSPTLSNPLFLDFRALRHPTSRSPLTSAPPWATTRWKRRRSGVPPATRSTVSVKLSLCPRAWKSVTGSDGEKWARTRCVRRASLTGCR